MEKLFAGFEKVVGCGNQTSEQYLLSFIVMFKKGKHVVKRYDYKFSAVNADVTLEKSINRSKRVYLSRLDILNKNSL